MTTEPTPSPEELKPQVQKVLVATDFSPCAERALAYAVRLAEKSGSELSVIHVAPTIQAPPGCSGHEYLVMQERSRERGREELRNLVDAHTSGETPLLLHLIAVEGIPSEEIIREAHESDIDIIVIATTGKTGFRRAFLGSTAEKVVRYATCPVLVVREKQKEIFPVI